MTLTQDLQYYRVGGSIRDELMGLPAGDRDWVVVGATPAQMIARGFRPVGKDFPVFLHPQSHEEYALARTERKTAPGYKGFAVHFSPDVTLEEDLLRRDLTINAMAIRGEQPADLQQPGQLIDPFNGLQDLRQRIFRHVSPAFREDPVRILRLARFAARFPDFTVAGETLALMREMSAAGEVNALVAERVWQEISRGLMSQRPSRMLQVLDDCHALAILLPPLSPIAGQAAWLASLDASAAAGDPLPVRFSILLAGSSTCGPGCRQSSPAAPGRTRTSSSPAGQAGATGEAATGTTAASGHRAKSIEQLARQLRAPNDCLDAARRLASEITGPMPMAARQWLAAPDRHCPAGLLALLDRHDAWRRPERLAQLLLAALRLAGLTGGLPPGSDAAEAEPPPGKMTAAGHDHLLLAGRQIRQALAASQQVDTGRIARQHAGNPAAIRAAINAARLQAIEAAMASRSPS